MVAAVAAREAAAGTIVAAAVGCVAAGTVVVATSVAESASVVSCAASVRASYVVASAVAAARSVVVASTIVTSVVVTTSVIASSVVASVSPTASGPMRVAHSGSAVEPHVAIGAVSSVVRTVSESSTIGNVDGGASEVVVSYTIAVEDGVVPAVSSPAYGAHEVVDCCVEPVLPVEEYVAQVLVAILPVVAEGIGGIVHGQEIVEVYLISTVVLLSCQIQLVCHLVRQEPGLLAC